MAENFEIVLNYAIIMPNHTGLCKIVRHFKNIGLVDCSVRMPIKKGANEKTLALIQHGTALPLPRDNMTESRKEMYTASYISHGYYTSQMTSIPSNATRDLVHAMIGFRGGRKSCEPLDIREVLRHFNSGTKESCDNAFWEGKNNSNLAYTVP